MKKMFALLLALSLLTALCLPCLAEENEAMLIEETFFLSEMDLTTEEWLSSDDSRAALASLIALEINLACGEESEIYLVVSEGLDAAEVYVAADDEEMLIAMYFGQSSYVFVMYDAQNDMLGGSVIARDASRDAETMMQDGIATGAITGYYAVSPDDILAFLYYLEDLMGIE
ncbi:MAG: hypothetical protein ACI4O7_06445 [Aristaeellaceae bacterium]